MTKDEIIVAIAKADNGTLERVGRALSGNTDPSHPDEPDFRLTTISDAAKRLCVSRPTIYRLIKDGKLDEVTLRGTKRVRVDSIYAIAQPPRRAISK